MTTENRHNLSANTDPEDIPEFDYDKNQFFEYFDSKTGKWVDERPNAMREFQEQRENEKVLREIREWQQRKRQQRDYEKENMNKKHENWDLELDQSNNAYEDPCENEDRMENEDRKEIDDPGEHDDSVQNEVRAEG